MELKDPNNSAKESLISCGIEAAWRLSDWGALEHFSTYNSKDTFESSLGRMFNLLKKKEFSLFESSLDHFSEMDHSLSSLGTYERDYDFYVQLHVKKDLGRFWNILKPKEGYYEKNDISSLLNSWEKRIAITKPNIRTRELILNVHMTLINIVMYLFDSKNKD